MSRELRWELSEEEVCEAIQQWVERQGDKVAKVRIENPNKASTIRFLVECIPPPLPVRFEWKAPEVAIEEEPATDELAIEEWQPKKSKKF